MGHSDVQVLFSGITEQLFILTVIVNGVRMT